MFLRTSRQEKLTVRRVMPSSGYSRVCVGVVMAGLKEVGDTQMMYVYAAVGVLVLGVIIFLAGLMLGGAEAVAEYGEDEYGEEYGEEAIENCPECGAEIDDPEAVDCLECGAPLPEPEYEDEEYEDEESDEEYGDEEATGDEEPSDEEPAEEEEEESF